MLNCRDLAVLSGLIFLTSTSAEGEEIAIAAGPTWIDTGIEPPFAHVAGSGFATTGSGDQPRVAQLNFQTGEWTTFEPENIISIAAWSTPLSSPGIPIPPQ